MKFFNAKYFFDLTNYHSKKIINDNLDVWLSLLNIKIFFQNIKFGFNKNLIPPSCHLENPDKIYIGENTLIEPNTYIKGPCYIGDNCQIRHGAYIRGNVITGNNCIIGHCTEIKNSILLNNVCASHFAYVGDSIIGNNVNLGAGVKLANYRLDKEEISFIFENKKIKTGLKKFGAIIGDNTQIGCNSVLNPATFLGKNVVCYAVLNIGGFIISNSIVKQPSKNLVKQLKSRDFKNELIASIKK
jgi:UDP-N-acetylglucosamine diphosphorylase / glucose-1-phosphate thymidylyltransferase / UDP-N-acetylgalactosamine diphosphorylase / glucosamine-1-phosphate N-acetyltransferase / galactosamine-1-phosphate N-acetyltransferase